MKQVLKIECFDRNDFFNTLTNVHEQLVGNPDYRENNIVLYGDDEKMIITLSIFKECTNVPKITI